MANSVVDTLTDWQNDADALDTNLPTNATNMGDGQPGDLDGEFRRVKSEIRSESIIKSWERWKGLKNLAATGNIAFTYVSTTSFSVNDNFTSVSRNVAELGRRCRAILSGSTIYGTITGAIFSSPSTTITVDWESGSLDATLTDVQFGPELRSTRSVLVLDKSNTPVTVVNDVTPTTLYRYPLGANFLGPDGRLRFTAVGRVGIRALHTLAIWFAWEGTLAVINAPLIGGLTTDRPAVLALNVLVEVFGNGSLSSQRVYIEAKITQAAVGSDAPNWAAPGAGNVFVQLTDASADLSIAQTFQLYVVWGQADPSDSVSFHQFLLEAML